MIKLDKIYLLFLFFKWPRYLVLNYHIFSFPNSLISVFTIFSFLFHSINLCSFFKKKKKNWRTFLPVPFRTAALPYFPWHHLLWGRVWCCHDARPVTKEAASRDLPDSWRPETWPWAKWRPSIETSSFTNSPKLPDTLNLFCPVWLTRQITLCPG